MNIKCYTLGLLLLSSVSLNVIAGGVITSDDKNEIRFIKNNKRLPDVAYQQELRESSAWKNFVAANGTWYVVFNEENAKPHRAFGKPVQAYGMDAKARAMDFILTKLSAFNLPVSELNFVGTGSSEKYQYVHFNQVHNGLAVLNSDVYVKLTPAGSVITFGCDVFNDITISTSPSISAAAARQFATTGINGNIVSSSVNSELFILPVPEFKENVYKLVYEITVETIDNTGIPARYYTLVNAENGEVLYRQNKIEHFAHPPLNTTDISISGTLYPTNPFNPSVAKPLRNLKMMESGTAYYSDSLGYLGLANGSPSSVNFSLAGLWSTVLTGTVTPTFTATANPGTNNFSFNSNANIREMSAYYNVNIVHDYVKTKYPTFTGMDVSLPTKIDLTSGTCNAFYDGSAINFYALGGGCQASSLIGDVIYHEYGHGINDKYYQSHGGNFGNGAMGEGYADTWALGITENPVLGTGWDPNDPTVYVRRYDINKKVYPQDLVGEVHADGEIIAGAWWDTGENMGNHQQMMNLFAETFNALITGASGTEGTLYVDVLIEALTDDDVPANGGDNDISNGTPHDAAIVSAFALHGITLLSNAVLAHTPVLASSTNATIPIVANVSVTYPWALSAVKVFYKINRLGAWSNLPMANSSGNTYTASIPAQPAGTVIAYYLALEGNTGILSAVQPIAADLANPNIPYFILNGVSLREEEDFDSNFGSWTVGVSGDNATTGQWVIDVPIGSYFTPGNVNTVVQPGYQHTPGGSMCAVTGNAASGAGLGTNDVDGGETTLESPVYNLSTYTNPIFTYYRWYINNPPSGANPANDTWEVQISNDNTNWVKVERTNVSDKSWRRFAFRVKDYITLSSTVKIRFVAEDSVIAGANLNGGSLVEAAIDDTYLYEEGTTGIDEESQIGAISVYPNPARNVLNLSYESAIAQKLKIELVNALGQIVFSKESNETPGRHQLKIETDGVAEGIYSLNVRTEKQNHVTKLAIMK